MFQQGNDEYTVPSIKLSRFSVINQQQSLFTEQILYILQLFVLSLTLCHRHDDTRRCWVLHVHSCHAPYAWFVLCSLSLCKSSLHRNACGVINSFLFLLVMLLLVRHTPRMRSNLRTEEKSCRHERRKLGGKLGGEAGGSMNLAAQSTRQKHLLTTMLITSTCLRFSPFLSFHFRERHLLVVDGTIGLAARGRTQR